MKGREHRIGISTSSTIKHKAYPILEVMRVHASTSWRACRTTESVNTVWAEASKQPRRVRSFFGHGPAMYF